ncbi:MAG: DUF2975 domain-containing protein [Lachnospiraceae bacterium]
MKQTYIAGRLKLICIVFALAGLLFFLVFVPFFASRTVLADAVYARIYIPGMFLAYTIGILCYLILYQFWKVTIKIGQNHSFCLENVHAFLWMSRFSLAISGLCLIFLLYTIVTDSIFPGAILLTVILLLIGLALTILTSALSHLIEHAYELQQENDLTI